MLPFRREIDVSHRECRLAAIDAQSSCCFPVISVIICPAKSYPSIKSSLFDFRVYRFTNSRLNKTIFTEERFSTAKSPFSVSPRPLTVTAEEKKHFLRPLVDICVPAELYQLHCISSSFRISIAKKGEKINQKSVQLIPINHCKLCDGVQLVRVNRSVNRIVVRSGEKCLSEPKERSEKRL